VVPNINLRGLDRVIICTAVGQRILFRQCAIRYKKSGSKVRALLRRCVARGLTHLPLLAAVTQLPRVELTESGPRFDLALRRHRPAPPELRKSAYAAPKAPKKRKNVGEDALVGTVGHVYVPRQEVDELGLSKPKGVKRGRRDDAIASKVAKRAGGGGGGGGRGGEGEGDEGTTPARGRKRVHAGADTPAGGAPGSYALSEGNLTAGKGLKKPKRPKTRAPADDE
jgi:ribosome production factor 2